MTRCLLRKTMLRCLLYNKNQSIVKIIETKTVQDAEIKMVQVIEIKTVRVIEIKIDYLIQLYCGSQFYC